MLSTVLAVHEGLGDSRRLHSIGHVGQSISAAELGVLFLLGASAALISAAGRLNLGIPGHNVIRVIFPMALGLAAVPRRGAASVMGASGMAAALVLTLGGARGIGVGALTSLVLTGLLLDLVLLGARQGRSIYVRFALAGLAANMAALLMRGGVKMLTGEPVLVWLPKAAVTYPVCGIVAGLISAGVWFRFGADSPPQFGGEDTA